MNPQQKIARRKVLYLGVILGLFTLSMFWRGVIPVPLSGTGRPDTVHSAADRVAARTVLSQATVLELRDVEQGVADLEGSAFNIALLGSRGVLVAILWNRAIEKQKRNDFHALDEIVQKVTKLQPHFITPWVFQSWNIAYNVSVEMQGSGDMYYYIARGIDLLAEGERRQTRVVEVEVDEYDPEARQRRARKVRRELGSPDMRHQIGFYYQNKFGVSDNVEVLRCLFQLSCIPPDDRKPDNFVEAGGGVNRDAFRAFCAKYPHLVRRLRGEDRRATGQDASAQRRIEEALKCPRAEDVVAFLRANEDVPGRYKSGRDLAAGDKQFPVLPPQFPEGPDEAHPGAEVGDNFTGYKAARAWFVYSMVPVPDNPRDVNDKPLPSRTPQAGEYNAVAYRVPRQPMLILFRQYPARAQSYQGEVEQREGWFDDDGWRVDDPAAGRANWWFPPADGLGSRPQDVVVGGRETGSLKWSLVEWRRAADMWREHGERYGLSVDPARLEGYQRLAFNTGGGLPPDPAPGQLDDPAFRARYEATTALFYYRQNRQVTNFPYFLASATAEAREETVRARKTLFEAEQARKLGNKARAVELYRDGLEQWKRVLAADPIFHGFGEPDLRTDKTQEDTYAYELSYLRLLVQDDEKVRKRADELSKEVAGVIRALPFPASAFAPGLAVRDAQEEFRWHVAEHEVSPLAQPMGEKDGVTDDRRRGQPWVHATIKEQVRAQQGVQRRPAAAPPPGGTEEKQ
ncbi:MAG: hypothetical protein C0501_25095 [Isosphaera sp.]|nr:hypothetical protein [Isosphaera sp.]